MTAPDSTPVAVRRLDTAAADFDERFRALQHWSAETDAAIESRVAEILADVQARGDAAVLDYTARFDRLSAASVAELEIGPDALQAALAAIGPERRNALEAAAARVRDYHQRQLEACGRSWQYRDADGTLLGQKVTPLDRVGIYVPGGKAAYPSSVLMNAIPGPILLLPAPIYCSSFRRTELILHSNFFYRIRQLITLPYPQVHFN